MITQLILSMAAIAILVVCAIPVAAIIVAFISLFLRGDVEDNRSSAGISSQLYSDYSYYDGRAESIRVK